MKYLNRFFALLCLVAFFGIIAMILSPIAQPLQPGRSSIRITQNRISHSVSGRGIGRITVDTFHLYNKAVRGTSLGSSVIYCTYLGRGGIKGSSTQWCNAHFTLPKGTITATGVQRSLFFYQLTLVGGTGIYANVMGTIVISQLARLHYNLIFALQAL